MRITPKSIWIIAIIVFTVYLSFVVLATLVPTTRELVGRVLLHPYSFIFIGGIVFSIVTYESYQIRKSTQRLLDELETKYQGPIKEKLLHRELKSWEQHLLEQKYSQTKNRNFDLDRRSPVFRIQGKLTRLNPTTHGATRIEEEWTVRGFTISEENYPDMRYKGFREGDELQVEFSPFSKWVWDVFKVYEGKRNWLLNINPKSFQYLKNGSLKILVRAPFGSHNLNEMKAGERLTLSEMDRGEIFEVELSFVKLFPNVEKLLEEFGVEGVCPGVETREQAISEINSYQDYSVRIAKGGVYAIGIKYLS